MAANIKKLFKANCGSGARYISHELLQRGEHNTVKVRFKIVPEGRTFDLDGVLHTGNTADEQLENAVLRIAGIAKNIRATMAAPDGVGNVSVKRIPKISEFGNDIDYPRAWREADTAVRTREGR